MYAAAKSSSLPAILVVEKLLSFAAWRQVWAAKTRSAAQALRSARNTMPANCACIILTFTGYKNQASSGMNLKKLSLIRKLSLQLSGQVLSRMHYLTCGCAYK